MIRLICWRAAILFALLHVLAVVMAGRAGYPVIPDPGHDCPSPAIKHGIGRDLKTFTRRIDLCAER